MEITLHEFIQTMQWAFVAGASLAVGFQFADGIIKLISDIIRKSRR